MAVAASVKCPRVIVTRPAREASNWVLRLQQAGIEAEALPLIEIASLDDTQALATAWQQLDVYTACMFVSGNAVDFFFSHQIGRKKSAAVSGVEVFATYSIADKLSDTLPRGLRFLGPGPGTVAALIDAGVSRSQIDAPSADAPQFDSEALWAVVGQRDWHGKRVLVVRGKSPLNGTADTSTNSGASASASASQQEGQGRDWITRQWQAAGAQVDMVSVYQRRAPTLNAAQLLRADAASMDGSVWLFSSSEAVANLADVQIRQGPPSTSWHGARAIATHPRIAETLRAAGWGTVHETRPALADIQALLHSIESSNHE